MKKYILLTSLIVIAISLQVVKVIYSNMFTTTGIDLNQLLTQEQNLEQQNIIISDQLYKKTAYTNIEKEAIKKGLSYNSNAAIAIDGNSPIALR